MKRTEHCPIEYVNGKVKFEGKVMSKQEYMACWYEKNRKRIRKYQSVYSKAYYLKNRERKLAYANAKYQEKKNAR